MGRGNIVLMADHQEKSEAIPTKVRRIVYWGLALVLGVSLGQSAVYATMRLLVRLTDTTPLSAQRATLNQQLSPRPYVDLAYQLVGIGFALVPVLLAGFVLTYLLWRLPPRVGDQAVTSSEV